MQSLKKKLKKIFLYCHPKIMSNRYSRKLAKILLNLSPYLKNRLQAMAKNQGLLPPPGNLNLADNDTAWMYDLDNAEVVKMLSSKAKKSYQRLQSELSGIRSQAR